MFEAAPDVLIVGAGPVGLFTALTLARQGVRVQIADSAFWTCAHSYALALHPRTLGLLKQAGVEPEIKRKSLLLNRIAFYDGSTRKAEIPLDEPLAVSRQDALESILEDALNHIGVRVQWRSEVSALWPENGQVRAKIDSFERESRGYAIAHEEWVVANCKELEVPWVIGADGYDSSVRRAIDAEFVQTGAPQYYAVFEFESDEPRCDELRVALGEDTTDALWPLPNGHWRWSFELPYYKAARQLAGPGYFLTSRLRDHDPKPFEIPVLEESTFRTLLALRAPWFKGDIRSITWRTVVRFEQRQASQYGAGRMWLAGDSAHLTGPVGVQSMNVGMQEGHDLAGIIAGGGNALKLQAYNDRWTGVWRQLHGLDKGVHPSMHANAWISDHVARILPCLPGYGNELVEVANHLAVTA